MTAPVVIGNATLYLGDCAEILPTLPRVDAVVTDPPYGVTDHEWDVVCPPGLWMVAKSAIVTATEPFATELINTAPLPFRYDLVWVKNCVTNAMNAHRMPMRRHERVLVFGNPTYTNTKRLRTADELKRLNKAQREKHPLASFDSVIAVSAVNNRSGERTTHPSQKPVELMSRLSAAFTSETETILDPFMGSGTTGVAAVQMGRKFIGIEREPEYFETACRRIREATGEDAGPLFSEQAA